MKKILVSLLIGLLAASLAVAPATAGKKKKKGVTQVVEGAIALQAPPADATDNPNGCYSGVHRRIAVASQEQVNGVVGYHFDIDPKTWNKKFILEVTGGEGIDIDITFYAGFGTPEQATDTSYAPPTQGFEERNTEGERGVVPADMTKAIVCMKVGQDATFTYTAGKGVK